jgi:uncharacterized protein
MTGQINSLVVKIAERCNLNCSYCYMYNHEDKSYLSRPRFMGEEVFSQLLLRIREYCDHHSSKMSIVFHGGEPTLIGAKKMGEMANNARQVLGERLADIGMQTNAILIDEDWIDVVRQQDIRVGVSLDGPAEVHDAVRVDHGGRGSHAATVNGLKLLQQAGLLEGVLCVVNPQHSGPNIYRYFRSIGLQRVNFLLPDVTHESKKRLYGQYSGTPVADYLIPIFDEWFNENNPDVKVGLFWGLISSMMGGGGDTDAFGNPLMSYLIIETDGTIHALDTLRVCEEDIAKSGLNLFEHGFDDLNRGLPLVYHLVNEGIALSKKCQACVEKDVCGGGYLPHRYARANGFDNPSAWCEDILKLLTHIRARIGHVRPFPLLEAQKPVVFFTNGIGDHFLALPALRALASLFPRRLTLICQKRLSELFAELPLRELIEVDMWMDEGRQFNVEIAQAIEGCDLFLSLVPWHSTSLTALLERLAPQTSLGFFSEYDIALPRDYNKHSSELAFDVTKYLEPSLKLEDYAAPPSFPLDAQDKARTIYELLSPSTRVLVVHADTMDGKMWVADRFIATLDAFLERHSNFVAMVVGEKYQPLDKGRCRDRVIPCYGLPIHVSFCLVAQADLFLGVDSCMLHVADLCRVPGVGLFGVTSSDEFGFRLVPHRHVCGNGAMDKISVGETLEALESLLEEIDSQSAKPPHDSLPLIEIAGG